MPRQNSLRQAAKVWSPPPFGITKINVDVVMSPIDRITISSCVARKNAGEIISYASHLDYNVDLFFIRNYWQYIWAVS
ncbi:hypothetical protein PTKIN_Ptkin01aG0141800 [Pterospermum kingtungense]